MKDYAANMVNIREFKTKLCSNYGNFDFELIACF